MKNKILLTVLVLFPMMMFGAEHGENHGMDAHQSKLIMYQTINVALLLFGLYYFLKKPAREYFQAKRSSFVAAAERAQKLREAAEQERLDIQVRLTKLQSTSDESIARARAEAADFKNALIKEANEVSKRIKKEAQEAAALEIERAKNRLRAQMIKEATVLAAGQMESKLTGDDQRRLQGEFIDHIQAVKA